MPSPRPCPAARHNTWGAYRQGCRCPEIVARVRASWRRRIAQRRTPSLRRWRKSQDVDDVAVARACAGEHLILTTGERREAVRRLTAQGVSVLEIAWRLGVSDRTVTRHRRLLREAAHDETV